jgi:flavin-dependent dehydrogenase
MDRARSPAMAQIDLDPWPVLIFGAGPAGCRLAGLLAVEGVRVLVLERPARRRPLLETLSSRSLIPVQSTNSCARYCYSNRSLWGNERLVDRPSMQRVWGPDQFIDRADFDSKLREIAISAGVTFYSEAVAQVERSDSEWLVHLRDRSKIRAGLIVDATGRASVIGSRIGGHRVILDTLVGTPVRLASTDDPTLNSTLVASVPTGWWYIGPNTGGSVGAIYFTDADLSSFADFRRAATLEEFGPTTEAVQLRGARVSGKPMAAFSGWLRPCAGDRWVAIGDAAASFDPLSSDGLRHALESAASAARSILHTGNFDRYRATMQVNMLAYLADRSSIYASERRWTCQPFWFRRQAPTTLEI